MAQQLLLLGGGQLLEDVGEAGVAESVRDVVAAADGQVEQGVGDVGGAHVLERGEQLPGALTLLREREPRHGLPRQHLHRAAAPEAPDVLAHREAGDQPVAGAGVLHVRVGDVGLHAVVDHPDPGVEHLPDHEDLVGALGERAEVDLAGGQRDRSGVDGGDPQHGHEDAASGPDADDEAQHPRRPRPHGDGRDGVAHPADVLAVRAENGQTDHPGDEHPGHGRAGRTHRPKASLALRTRRR